jgi:hypothetical protein
VLGAAASGVGVLGSSCVTTPTCCGPHHATPLGAPGSIRLCMLVLGAEWSSCSLYLRGGPNAGEVVGAPAEVWENGLGLIPRHHPHPLWPSAHHPLEGSRECQLVYAGAVCLAERHFIT